MRMLGLALGLMALTFFASMLLAIAAGYYLALLPLLVITAFSFFVFLWLSDVARHASDSHTIAGAATLSVILVILLAAMWLTAGCVRIHDITAQFHSGAAQEFGATLKRELVRGGR